jgi:hypothetical protein
MVVQGKELTSFVAPSEVIPSQICVLVLSVVAKLCSFVRAVKRLISPLVQREKYQSDREYDLTLCPLFI